jgi:hypothetical protein
VSVYVCVFMKVSHTHTERERERERENRGKIGSVQEDMSTYMRGSARRIPFSWQITVCCERF